MKKNNFYDEILMTNSIDGKMGNLAQKNLKKPIYSGSTITENGAALADKISVKKVKNELK